MIFVINIYLFIIAVFLALLEIQIEGAEGWARNLPTWRPKNKHWYVRLYSKILSGKELTGYHLSMFTLVFLILALPFVFGFPLTLENILKTVSFYFMITVLWDFLWFVCNPYYPLRKFKAEHLSFHHIKWLLGIPVDYFFGLGVSLLVLLPVAAIYQSDEPILWWLINIFLFSIQTTLVILFTLYVLKIDKWNESKHRI